MNNEQIDKTSYYELPGGGPSAGGWIPTGCHECARKAGRKGLLQGGGER